MIRHTLSMLVQNEPGALTRIVTLLSGRGVRIDSLRLEQEGSGVARLDVVAGLRPDRPVEQLVKQLSRLVHVLRVVELTNARDQLGA
jgi:acetolactate synthase-1/3 small subunit